MQFRSDNAGPVHPDVLAALTAANEGYAPAYGGDDLTARATALIRDLFEAPQAAVAFVTTGTAANALALACLGQPWQGVFCARHAHIAEDECGAPEFYGGGSKLILLDRPDCKIAPEALAAAMEMQAGAGLHGVQPGPVSLTQATERGTAYGRDEIAELARITHGYGQRLHMDGARFANALLHLGCSPAEMTWKAGVDALSLGGTKNGLMGVEAVVIFDPEAARELELRRKRGGHLWSRHRYLAAQWVAALDGGLWRDLAARANGSAAYLAAGLAASGAMDLAFPCQSNLVFATAPRALHQRLHRAGAHYTLWDAPLEGALEAPLLARFVCDWALERAEIDRFLALLGAPA